jgi:hypothetical protein
MGDPPDFSGRFADGWESHFGLPTAPSRTLSASRQELSADKKYLGAATGHTAVLHTWGQNLRNR